MHLFQTCILFHFLKSCRLDENGRSIFDIQKNLFFGNSWKVSLYRLVYNETIHLFVKIPFFIRSIFAFNCYLNSFNSKVSTHTFMPKFICGDARSRALTFSVVIASDWMHLPAKWIRYLNFFREDGNIFD